MDKVKAMYFEHRLLRTSDIVCTLRTNPSWIYLKAINVPLDDRTPMLTWCILYVFQNTRWDRPKRQSSRRKPNSSPPIKRRRLMDTTHDHPTTEEATMVQIISAAVTDNVLGQLLKQEFCNKICQCLFWIHSSASSAICQREWSMHATRWYMHSVQKSRQAAVH